jgi:potassium-dependent mechanosensitive channel
MKKYILSLLFPVLLFPAARGQDSAFLFNNAVKHETREIDLAKISLESTEIIFSLNRELRQVVSDKELQELMEITNTKVVEIDSIFNTRPDSYLELQNIRSIRNHINFWKLKYNEIDGVDSRISEINKRLDKSRLKHARELASWNEIRQIASEYGYEDAAMGRINHVIGLLDSTVLIMANKSNRTLSMLDMTNECKVEINERIDYYDKLLKDKQKNIFRSGYPSFLELEYGNTAFWRVSESFRVMHKGEFRAFWAYFGKNIGTVLIHVLLLAVAILVLVYLKKIGIPEVEYEDVNYRRSLKIILSNPINSALILVLFASTLLYSNKPVLFLELFKLIVSVPLAVTLINMAHRKYWSIIIAFEFLVILQTINANLPASLVPARLLLLLTAFMEVFTLLLFINKIKKATWRLKTLQKILMILCYVHLGLAIVAVFTNLTGKILLTKSLLNAVSGTALATTLIFLAMLVGNGLMMIFLDSGFSDYIHLVRKRRTVMKQKVTRIFQVMAGIFMIYYVLEAYGIELFLYEWLQQFFQKERILGSLNFTWGNIAIFFLVIWLSVFFSKIIRIVLEEEVLDRMGMSKGLPNTIALLVKYTLVAAGFLAAVSAAGLKMTNLTIILGAMSVGIGFGLQNIFNNLVSGLILLLERPIKIGDTIEVGTMVGVVKSIGIRASNVHTLEGAEIIVPNGNLVSNEVINWTLTDKRRRIEVLVGVAYGTDPYKVQEIFLKILANHPDVVKDPSPNVLFNNFGESSLDFRLLFWTDNFDEWIRIRSEIIFKIYDALKEAGIEIPFPQHVVHLRTPDAMPPEAE